MKKKTYIICAICAVLLILLGTALYRAKYSDNKAELPTTIDELANAQIGVVSGAGCQLALEKRLPDATIVAMKSETDGFTALKSGKLDAFATSLTTSRALIQTEAGYHYIDDTISTNNYAILIKKDNVALQTQLNEAIATLESNGVLTELQNKWFGDTYGNEQEKNNNTSNEITNATLPVDATPLQVMTTCANEPFTYYDENGKPTGYEVELITLLAEQLGRPVNFTVCETNAILPAIASKLADCAISGFAVNEGRANSYAFTNPIYSDPNIAILFDSSAVTKTSLWQRTYNSFIATFIAENRWKLIVDGMLVTIELSLLSAILGTALGFAASYPLRSTNRRVRKISTAISAFISGTPLVIILMVMYYLLFSHVNVPPMLVGAFGFMLDLGNSLANILNSGVSSINYGQQESALALGYSKSQIFMKITLPQALRRVFPQYKSALVSMVKGTSIIGYITLQDLTKAVDIIRGRTYAPFFPLIVTAILYFLLAKVLLFALHLIELKLDPKRRPRAIEGVQVHD